MIDKVISYLYALPGVFFALSIHEFFHGFVAYKLGDSTAKSYGRLTLNPIKHIDPIGLIAMFVVGVGWANPVPVDSRYFKNPRRDMALVALAGPLSNFISAFVGMIVLYSFWVFILFYPTLLSDALINGIFLILQSFVLLNIGLGIFNLIPIPPLDGSRILDSFLPPKALLAYHRYEQIIRVVLLVVLILDLISITPAVNFVYHYMFRITELIVGFVVNLFV